MINAASFGDYSGNRNSNMPLLDRAYLSKGSRLSTREHGDVNAHKSGIFYVLGTAKTQEQIHMQYKRPENSEKEAYLRKECRGILEI